MIKDSGASQIQKSENEEYKFPFPGSFPGPEPEPLAELISSSMFSLAVPWLSLSLLYFLPCSEAASLLNVSPTRL